jgi:hypothetical protein
VGSALTHHPHVHGIVPGGSLSPDGQRCIACQPGFFLPVRVLSRLFRRRFLEALEAAHRQGQLQFFGEYASLTDPPVFTAWLAPLRACEWVVYAKRPFAGPEAVLAYLSRYTHRVAISNQRLLAFDERGVTFRWKDYRAKGRTRYKTMTLEAGEFMRRFMLHVLPGDPVRRARLAKVRELLHVATGVDTSAREAVRETRPAFICRHCGADDGHRYPRAHRTDPRPHAPGPDMNTTVSGRGTRPSASRQRGPGADVCACRFTQSLTAPVRHHDCATELLRHRVSAHPASRPAAHTATPPGIVTHQSP